MVLTFELRKVMVRTHLTVYPQSPWNFWYVVYHVVTRISLSIKKISLEHEYSLEHRYTSRRSAQDVVNSHDVGIYYTAATCKRETFGVSE